MRRPCVDGRRRRPRPTSAVAVGAVERDVGQRPGHVERHHVRGRRSRPTPVRRAARRRRRADGTRSTSAGTPPPTPTTLRTCREGGSVGIAGVPGHGARGGGQQQRGGLRRPTRAGRAGRRRVPAERDEVAVATTALVRNGDRAPRSGRSPPATTAASRADAPAPPQLLGHQQRRPGPARGEGRPRGRRHVVGRRRSRPSPARAGSACRGRRAPTRAGRPRRRRRAARLAGRGCGRGHRGRSFQATSLSTRGSVGRPRTRSATMLRRISEVPPSMELPLARR